MEERRQIVIDPLSVTSLFLELLARGNRLSTATGFVVQHSGTRFLVTNLHVLAGRQPETNSVLSPTGALPDHVRIAHHTDTLGTWVFQSEPILDDEERPLWVEHPSGSQVDIAALQLREEDERIRFYELDLSLADTDMVPQVAMPVSIIGFPLGLTSAGAFPIWKTGHIASDPDIDYQGRPAFLIDATTRGGMSGSPVVLRMQGGYSTRDGRMIMAQSRPATRFLGIYSGRIHGESEIGLVWRPNLLTEILAKSNLAYGSKT